MNEDRVILEAGNLKKQIISPREAFVLNVKFKSMHKFQFLHPELEQMVGKIKEDAAQRNEGIHGDDNCGGSGGAYYEFFALSNGNRYPHAFRSCSFPVGNDGWAAMQYSFTDSQQGVDFLVDTFLKSEELLAEARVVSVRKIDKRLEDLNAASIMDHFRQCRLNFHGKWDYSQSRVSDDILKIFADKGWNLYHNDIRNNGVKQSTAIVRGSVESMVVGQLYSVVPAVSFPQSERVVTEAIENVEAKKLWAFIRHSGHHKAETIALFPDGLFVCSKSSPGYTIPYKDVRHAMTKKMDHYVPAAAD